MGCCERGWLERHNEMHEWQITVGYVLTPNKSFERFAFRTTVPVFVGTGKQPTRMACLFNNMESMQQLVQQIFLLTISKTWTPTPKMGRQLAQIYSIRISTLIMVWVCSRSRMLDHVWRAVCWLWSIFVFIVVCTWLLLNLFVFPVSWKDRSHIRDSHERKRKRKLCPALVAQQPCCFANNDAVGFLENYPCGNSWFSPD
jgi:hypothetical protein